MPSDVVSRESYGAAVERLNSFAAGADAERVAAVADDVLSVARLLAREPRLRRALVDPARPAEARVDLLRTLLGGKVADEALDLVALLVGGRWGPPTELLNATERLGVEALLASAERAGHGGPEVDLGNQTAIPPALGHEVDRLVIDQRPVLDRPHAGADRALDPLRAVRVRRDEGSVFRRLLHRGPDLVFGVLRDARLGAPGQHRPRRQRLFDGSGDGRMIGGAE